MNTLVHEIVVPANHPSLAGHFPGQPDGARGGAARCGAGGNTDARSLRAAIDSRRQVPATRVAGGTHRTAHPVHRDGGGEVARQFSGIARRLRRLRRIVRRFSAGFGTMNDWRSHKERSTPSMVRLIVRLATRLRRHVRAPTAVPDRRVLPAHEPDRAGGVARLPAARARSRARLARSVETLLRLRELHARSHFPAVETPSVHRGGCRPAGRGSRRGRRARPAACCSWRISAARSRCASSRWIGAACRCRSCSTANMAACSPNYSRN